MLLHFLGWLRPVEGIAARLINPISATLRRGTDGGKSFYDAWLAKRNLLAENNAVKERLVQYQVDSAKFQALQEENELLKKELKFAVESKLKFAAAKIVSGVSDPFSQTVVIDRGSEAGLAKGMAVITGQGVMVGKIIEAQKNYSKVLLLTDNKSKVAATVQNLDHTAGIVEGQFGLSFIMTNIPRNQFLKEGDLIVTSGLEGQVPKNLLLAEVESVKEVESEIFKTAVLKPIVSFSNLSSVLVIIP